MRESVYAWERIIPEKEPKPPGTRTWREFTVFADCFGYATLSAQALALLQTNLANFEKSARSIGYVVRNRQKNRTDNRYLRQVHAHLIPIKGIIGKVPQVLALLRSVDQIRLTSWEISLARWVLQ
jgi:hypothetical protein